MKTEIPTAELLKLLNPNKEAVTYKGQKIQIDLKKLKEYVEAPRKNEVFNLNNDLTNDLHKNLALYIINDNDESHIINLDLNKESIFEPGKGLFEYIKNIYKKNKTSYINIDEIGDNLLLIKGKKLLPLSNSGAIKEAIDTHYASIASIFSDTTKIDLNAINKDKLDTKGQVTWQEDNYDNYSNEKYVLEKISKISYSHEDSRYSRSSNSSNPAYTESFNKIVSMTHENVLNSNSFKLALIDMENKPLNGLLIARYYDNQQPKSFYINFSENIFQDKLLQLVSEEKFNLFESLILPYVKNLKYHENLNKREEHKPTSAIDFEILVNHPKTVEHLIKKYHYRSSSSNEFNIVGAYSFFNEENKKNTQVVDKYLDLIIDRGEYTNINHSLLFKMPVELFNDKGLLSKIIPGLNFKDFKNFLNENKIETTPMSDKEFILSGHQIPHYKLAEWIKTFVDKKELDKEYFKDVLISFPKFYDILVQNWYSIAKDVELIYLAIRGGVEIKSINSSIIEDLLLQDHEPKYEEIKIRHLIENRNILDISKNFLSTNHSLDKINKVKEKYEKIEYMFYKPDNWYSEYDGAKRALAKIKNKEEVIELIERIENSPFSYEFNANFFYNSLHKPLKKDKIILEKILDLGTVRYQSLDENLAYNTDVVIKCLSQSPSDLKHIPQEFFSSSTFAIKFAELMDKHTFDEKNIPSFITKFFENQEISSNYADYLKMHLSYKEMQGDLETSNTPTKTKRVKL